MLIARFKYVGLTEDHEPLPQSPTQQQGQASAGSGTSSWIPVPTQSSQRSNVYMINTEEPTTDEQPSKRDLLSAYHNSYSMLSFEEYVQQQREIAYDKASLPKYTEDENVLEAVPKKIAREPNCPTKTACS